MPSMPVFNDAAFRIGLADLPIGVNHKIAHISDVQPRHFRSKSLKLGRKLRATEVLIFGNPQGGTPFMECAQSIGIDLPLKALVWQDEAGKVWLGYNDPAYLAARHGVASCPAAAGIAKALAGLVQEALKQ